ncbi:hypothetical protein COU62_01475 [Candidatus Pacearchaeota archaeon CG10_big_fil_rev_8_21_14_0_10_35_219]|nr:hypothetical protein [Candidatus Pacearchaeota archaeon]OIO43394.1 MAG: hypothetical protein AUJ63_00700 [Candidatus Pacearchaeota archaeon CG1_02_35_32]PIO08038.1 MAG: hypothetical protein COU62_01475 [Candidatus Pacearchaeota archaeon CG10_big_fil_rev_8_21_14_0_10_35_219]PIY81550.1 MAG: hypothetical protein COY79_02315 [Candidatus Pacearchaeota archaeon CG_4_10_14_0_8_um_filter_35_169]PIZ78925.1 MAG: hypothetical protein COY00_04700 [Candidatus Pacearchaeota archaeon CG_4_10_14_0_2_um_filt
MKTEVRCFYQLFGSPYQCCIGCEPDLDPEHGINNESCDRYYPVNVRILDFVDAIRRDVRDTCNNLD